MSDQTIPLSDKDRADMLRLMYDEKVSELTAARAEAERYRVLWARDSTGLGKVLADLRTAKAVMEDRRAEVEALRADAADFHMAYRMKCDEETKAQAVGIERLRAALQGVVAVYDQGTTGHLVGDASNGPRRPRQGEADMSDQIAWYRELIEMLEAERDEAQAELARLTTLRPASEHDGKARVLVWKRETYIMSANRAVLQFHNTKVPYGCEWTPLPPVKEADHD